MHYAIFQQNVGKCDHCDWNCGYDTSMETSKFFKVCRNNSCRPQFKTALSNIWGVETKE